MGGRRTHVTREALPWREATTETECGRNGERLTVIGRSEWHTIAVEWNTLARDYQRAGMPIPATVQRPNICLTCWEKASRWPTWRRDPIKALQREIEALGWYAHEEGHADARRLAAELWALARLAAGHPNAFAAICQRIRTEIPARPPPPG